MSTFDKYREKPDNPSAREVFSDTRMLLAFGLGSGLSPRAPGTAGTIVALLIYYLALQGLAPFTYLLVLLVSTLLGIYLCGYAAGRLGVHDHGGIVWDEFVGLWLTLYAVPAGWWWPLVGFLLFRLFDIVKPFPINWFDRQVGGGLGIMLDDILAGSMAFICVQLLAWCSVGWCVG